MTDEMDRLLEDDAARWRHALPDGPGPAELLGVARANRPAHLGWWAAVVTSAAVAIIAVVSAVVITRRSPNAPASGAQPCVAHFSVASSRYIPTRAPGFQNIRITLSYTGAQPCLISAYGPEADLLGADDQIVGSASHTTLELRRPDHLRITHADTVVVDVRWTPPCGSALPRVEAMTFRMAGLGGSAVGGFRVPVPSNYRPPCSADVLNQDRIDGFVSAPTVNPPNRSATGLTPTGNPTSVATRLTPGSSASVLRQCATRSLGVHGGRQGGGQIAHGDVVLENLGARPCIVPELRSIRILDAAGHDLMIRQATPTPRPTRQISSLAPHAVAGLSLAWMNWCHRPPGPLTIALTFVGDSHEIRGPFNGPPDYDYVPPCLDSTQPSTIRRVA